MPTLLASELQGKATDIATTNSHLLPGDSITVRVKANDGDVLSAATMLIETNDGFTGLDSVALTDGNTDTMAYDAGAEDNTEKASDIPGPPFGGHNSGPDTNPPQPIAAHQGIKGTADVKLADFNWSGPVARFTIQKVASTGPSMVEATPTAAPAAPTSEAMPAMGPSTSGGTTAPAPGMPHTGSGDNAGWLVLLAAAGALLLSGLGLGRVYVRR
jgi:hypothetical protein